MKKLYFLMLLSLVAMTIKAQLLFEPFNYTPDPTNGLYVQSGGLWLRVNTGDTILVTAGNLSYPGLAASTGNKVSFEGAGADYYRLFTPQTSGTVYYSFIMNTPSLGSLDATGGYFITLMQTGSTSAFGASIWTRASITTGKYNIGISTRSNSAVSWLPNDLDPGSSYFVVAAYDIITGTANDVARLWLNTAAIGGAEPAADITAVPGTDISTAGIERILLRQDTGPETAPVDIDEVRVGTAWADVTPGGVATPALTISSPLSPFGNVCINTTSGPNSFTITGSNLTTADVTVAALAGYTYSTTAGGTYTTTLNITQPGGAFSQQVFVKFDPVAVQSYNGNIAVAGGGVTTAINAAASGAGVNTIPSLTTGSATTITQVSATLAGTITATGCTPVTVYGIEYSTTSGFPNGSGIQVASTNISGGNYTSALAGLTSGTTFYYKAYATNAGGTGYGTEQSFTTATPNPTINTTALTAFGNVCINITAGPNSFAISGANLTTADVTVGPLAGFTFSTTAGGTYTASLSLTQPGGTYSQDVFVKFTPVAVQSYSGDIPVAGGGVAATVNVSASGAGVNTAPSVSTGGASAITTTTASLAGTIAAAGCTSVTVYGIEYSTTSGFPNGSGLQVVSTNISGGNFTSGLSGLIPSTTYYYKAFATNAGGTTYGVQQSFTTAAPPPPVLTATALTPFGNACITTTAGPNSFIINGANLTTVALSVGPLAGYTFSEIAGGTYVTTLAIAQTGGTQSKTVFVKFTPAAVQSYNGNIPVSGGGATVITVAASGNGVNTLATVITGATTGLTTQSAVLAGSVSDNGCSNVTTYGIEYSGVNGFTNGTGIQVASSNLTGGNFTISLSGLVQGATYYYKAYAVNNGGISYGLQQSFTVLSINPGFSLYPSPAVRGTDVRLTMTDITPGYYGLLLFNSNGQLVFQRNMNIQAGFINQVFTIPATLSPGVYTAYLVNHLATIGTRTILVQ